MEFEVFARTDTGPVRENNEDNMLLDHEIGLFVVADGMGGHASGEVASEIAVNTIKDVLLGGQDPDETRLSRLLDEEESIRERLRYGMNQASKQRVHLQRKRHLFSLYTTDYTKLLRLPHP